MEEGERLRKLLEFQREEITEHYIYSALARRAKGQNQKVLTRISGDELGHYNVWKSYTGYDLRPSFFSILKYRVISYLFGITFTMKLMEGGEKRAEKVYSEVLQDIPEKDKIIKEEITHERALINMIDEERINYIGSMVLGLNDALVELTGALAGLTFALRNTKTVAIAGFITGFAASLSMAASEYLSQKSEIKGKNPGISAFYTGFAYIITVLLLIFPYFIFKNYIVAFGTTILVVFFVVYLFTFFVSVIKEISLKRMFLEMIGVSLGVAVISFLIGWAARVLFHIAV